MKSIFETEGRHDTKAKRRLAGPAVLLLLGFLVSTAFGFLTVGLANEVPTALARSDWYLRCRAEVQHVIAVVNYVLTPEDDVGAMESLIDGQLILPALGASTPVRVIGTADVGTGQETTDGP